MMQASSKSGRWLAIFSLVALLSVGLAACGDDNSDNGDSGSKSDSAKSDSPKSKNAEATAGLTSEETANAVNDSDSDSIVAGGRVFAANSPWNTEIDGLPVDADSNRMLDLAEERRAVREDPGQQGIETIIRRVTEGVHINTEAWAPLIVEAGGDGSEVTEFVCRQSKCGSGDPKVPGSLPIPANTTPDPRYDGWLSVIDSEAGIGYDFWRARRQSDNSISYQYAKAWTLDGPGFSKPVSVDPDRAVGARGSGLPLFAGVIGAEEASQGRINHALAIAVPGLARRNFVQPASVTDGNGSPKSLPAGARIRLKANVTAEDREINLKGARRRSAESILVALRQYGAIVVDRAAVPTLYTPRGTSNAVVNGSELSWLTLDDFEVIELPQLYQDPPLSKVNLEGTDTSSSGGQG
ncbi:MAG TPA: hypothetical protein VMF31_01440 [Solirubrobacterales bacterium]|nr:hypothetical protein [Solirubrobacterales bacterium]